MTSDLLQAKTSVENVKTGIQNADREAVAKQLSKALADSYALYLKTQGFHWNVVGPLFYGLHKLTEVQYEEMAAAIDEIAERIRALGHPSPAGFAAFQKLTSITDSDGTQTGDKMIRALVADHETLARGMRELAEMADGAGDVVTADLATQRLDSHEKAVWMLRALIAE